MKIAIDAMGGDYAPEAIIHGVVEATRAGRGECEVILVGDESRIKSYLARHFRVQELPISVVHAPKKIDMSESPTAALRQKPDASINVAMQLQNEGKAGAVVSAGHTGAVMASAFFCLGTMKGVRRPAIGSLVPHAQGATLLIDVGANLEVRPTHLLQFGIMGDIYMKNVHGLPKPRVGILNIGSEESKGKEVIQKAYGLLGASGIHFIGNIEGRDIMGGDVDVIVCDGFTGNIVLKFAESFNGV
ncbi:phosphate acyltransferase PlsX, partial [bacterium]|nr:phosphate acyltransferase PlsX [bacterium]